MGIQPEVWDQMLKAVHLSKNYGKKAAVKNLCFHIDKGEIIGFLGPNGAGKSTSLNMITGALSATSGDALICGHSILEEPMKARSCIGYLPETPPLYPEMKVKEYIRFICRLKHVPYDRSAMTVCEKTGIGSVLDRTIRNLSKGYRQRVGLAQAMIGNPPLLILDEPTSGMDPGQTAQMRELLLELKNDHTILFSSHILSEIESVCSRLLILRDGSLIADDTPEALRIHPGTGGTLILQYKGSQDSLVQKLSSIPGVGKIRSRSTFSGSCPEMELELAAGDDEMHIREQIFFAMAELKIPLLGLRPKEYSLEELFLTLTA